MLMTSMLSLTPATPATSEHMPRTITRIFTPAWLAS